MHRNAYDAAIIPLKRIGACERSPDAQGHTESDYLLKGGNVKDIEHGWEIPHIQNQPRVPMKERGEVDDRETVWILRH